MKKTVLKKYAELLIKCGVNIQKGQTLKILADVEASDFVPLMVNAAYKAGAKKVTVEWSCREVTKLHYRHQSVKTLCEVQDWEIEKVKRDAEILPARIRLICEDPDGLKSVNQEKLAKAGLAYSKAVKVYTDSMDNKYQWLVCAIPGKAWAKKVFPGVPAAKAKEMLWEAILSTVMVSEDGDAVAAWEKKNNDFKARCDYLNSKKFDYLHYKSASGTDFNCHLMEKSKWCGGGENSLQGIYFNPNMPTEEIFTTPKKGACEGRLVSTMHLSVRGTLIENFYIDFKDGKAVSWHADKGEEALGKIITTDEGSCMLGELALVPVDSPISASGLLYYNTLFDENASCHVALGSGYTGCVDGFESMTLDELHELGVNDSHIHVDFMVGSDDMTITGYKDGVPTVIFENGKWAQSL